MISGNREHDADDDLGDLVDGLEQLARHLDAERYPGSAWPASAPRRRRPFAWQVVALLAAAAAATVMGVALLDHGRAPQSPVAGAPGRGATLHALPTLPESLAAGEKARLSIAVPSVVLVEDAESYSFIDMTAGTPVVSFAKKDSYSPVCVVPICDAYQPPPDEEGRAGGAQSGP